MDPNDAIVNVTQPYWVVIKYRHTETRHECNFLNILFNLNQQGTSKHTIPTGICAFLYGLPKSICTLHRRRRKDIFSSSDPQLRWSCPIPCLSAVRSFMAGGVEKCNKDQFSGDTIHRAPLDQYPLRAKPLFTAIPVFSFPKRQPPVERYISKREDF